MQPHDDPLSRFHLAADAALKMDALRGRIAGEYASSPFLNDDPLAAGLRQLVRPLARRALDLARGVLQPPNAAVLRPQPYRPVGDGRPAGDPRGDVRPDAQPLPSSLREAAPSGNLTLHEAREQWERTWIADRLRDHRGNIQATAAAIGMERSALTRKLRLLGVQIGPIRAEEPNESP